MRNVHGHEVMRMMMESNKGYTKESLQKDIIDRFGDDARFFTCSAQNMTAEELIEFLNFKEKFVQKQDGLTTDPDKMCNH